MKQILKMTMIAFFGLITIGLNAQKKQQTFQVSKVMPFPAETVWAIVGEDYGSVAYSHPKIIESNYINGTLKSEEGAERVCYFNEKKTQFLKEKMVNYSPETMTFTNRVYQAGKFPVDPELTHAVYSIKDLGNGTSEFSFDMSYRTKPGFMGAITKGKFKKLINDYFIALEHHIKTGEKVTKENFKDIKKLYTHSIPTKNSAALAGR